MDRDRSGVVTEADLHCFYKGHIGRTLKRFAKRKNARRRTLRTWLCGSGASVLLTLPFWGMVVSVVMVPSAIAGMWYAVGQRSFLQLVINFYLTLFAILMVVVESRIDATRRLALHVHRYAQLLPYGAARGALFLLAALALLAQDTDWLCPLAYATELVGLAYIILGTRTVTRIRQLQRKLRTVAAVRASFRAVAHDQPSLQAFGLRLLGQSVNLPARWKVDTLALLDTLDLDRDGAVSEAELVYWLCDEASLGAEVTAAANDDDDDDSDVGAPTEVVVSPSAHATPAMSVAADQPQHAGDVAGPQRLSEADINKGGRDPDVCYSPRNKIESPNPRTPPAPTRRAGGGRKSSAPAAGPSRSISLSPAYPRSFQPSAGVSA